MKILFLLLIVSPICLHAMSSVKLKESCRSMTSDQYMVECSDKLKNNGDIDEAINLFGKAISTEYGSPFGMHYNIIINGLFKLGILSADDIIVEDYGLTAESKQKLLSIISISDRKTYLRKVFAAISSRYKDGIHGKITISGFNEYFDQEFGKDGSLKMAKADFFSAKPKIRISESREVSGTISHTTKTSKEDGELTKPKKMIAKDINSQNIVGKGKTGATNVGHETRKRMKYSGKDGDNIAPPATRKSIPEYTQEEF